MAILVTGCAGFIGSYTAHAFLEKGFDVIGIDNLNAYYDPQLKKDRLARITTHPNFIFEFMDFSEQSQADSLFIKYPRIEGIIHLGAQAGVRHSLTHPHDYVKNNITAQVALMTAAKRLKHLKHFVYASSSSVYGANTKLPFSVQDPTDTPLAPYGASKKACEMMAHSYAHLYQMPLTGLRFFTVYGPWGRPDMAAYIFASKICQGIPIQVYNHGKMRRDFTYIDDIVKGIMGCYQTPPTNLTIPHRVFNLGNSKSEKLTDFISEIEKALGIKAQYEMCPMQPGDVPETYANIEDSQKTFGFLPQININEGIPRFIAWFKDYHNIKEDMTCKQVS